MKEEIKQGWPLFKKKTWRYNRNSKSLIFNPPLQPLPPERYGPFHCSQKLPYRYLHYFPWVD